MFTMITRILYPEEKVQYDQAVVHPVQTWAWGDFQQTQGHKIYRFGVFSKNKIISAYSVSFHHIPHTHYSIGTLLRGPQMSPDMIDAVAKVAAQENAIFVKFEPDVYQSVYDSQGKVRPLPPVPELPGLVVSPKEAFFPYSYVIDLTPTEEELLASTHSKTRYNIRLANRHGVKVEERTTDEGFEIYLDLIFETTKRQGFYLHSRQYHRDLWQTIKKTDMPHILIASYQNKPIAAFMLFALKDRFFYPYGASLDLHRNVMAPNLLMWEAVRLGKKLGCRSFDMWGSLGPDASPSDNGYGFHRFKQGYGGHLVRFVGTYDLVINRQLYSLYNLVDKYRWKLLRLKTALPFVNHSS